MTTKNNTKLGLVLSGGGAKGAYQAGILKYMAEQKIQPDMVSGTSIGALNAAIISAQKDITKASKVINDVWSALAKESPVKANKTVLFISSAAILMSFSTVLTRVAIGWLIDKVFDKAGVVSETPLTNIMEKYASVEELAVGLPLYVSLYESEGSIKDIAKYLSQSLFNGFRKDSKFKHIQSLDSDIMHEAIMASAALPYIFKAQEIEDEKYRDGGMGGAYDEQGNTPAQPLAEAGCTHLIVSLLSDGSVFDRHDPLYKDVAIIEVRPKEHISISSLDLFAFKPQKIQQWMQQGYDDAKRCIGNSLDALKIINEHEKAKEKVTNVLHSIENDGFNIKD